MLKGPRVPVLTIAKLTERWGCSLDELRDLIVSGTLSLAMLDDKATPPSWVRFDLKQAIGELGLFGLCYDNRVLLEDVERLETVAAEEKVHERNSNRHRERCRAIAALLWEKEPTRTIEDMILAPEILRFGQEGVGYINDTVRDWIKDLCPNRKPGRRPKNSRQQSE
jgi:hypothetical protein